MNLESYFGPLDKKYCIYFYLLSIFFGFVFIFTLISIIIGVVIYHKKINKSLLMHSIFVLLNSFIAYFVNRLLNTMCNRSLV